MLATVVHIIRMWKQYMRCCVAGYMPQPFKGHSFWTDAFCTFSSQTCQVVLKCTWVYVQAASAWQHSREFYCGHMFMGINLLFVSSFTTRCSSLGTCTIKKCRFEFNKFNCGNISNMQQVYACFYIFLVYCTEIPYFSFWKWHVHDIGGWLYYIK
jgi:hypothetical protein